MTSENELFIQQHLLAIVKRLDDVERKLDNLLSSEDPEQVAITDRTETNRISQVVRPFPSLTGATCGWWSV